MEGASSRVAASSPARAAASWGRGPDAAPADGAEPAPWGPYVLGRRIGRGAMGVVHAAVHRGPSGIARLVAVKILVADRADHEGEREAFLREARILARLDHPNVVRWLDAGEVGGDVFIAMELLHGASLAQIVAASPDVLPLPIAIAVIADLARGLHAAHELVDEAGRPLGLVHQDVSPQNAVVGYDGRTRLVDFGIARLASVDASRTDTVRGKPAYLAPEQLEGRRLDRRTDVFALGVMAFEILAGRRLFARASIAETHTAVLFEPIPDLRDVRPELPADLAAVVACALSRSPGGRFNTAEALRRALVEARDEAGIPVADEREIARLVEARVPPPWRPHELFAEIAGDAAPSPARGSEGDASVPPDDLSRAATVAPRREVAAPKRDAGPPEADLSDEPTAAPLRPPPVVAPSPMVGLPTNPGATGPAMVGLPTNAGAAPPAMVGLPTNAGAAPPAMVGLPTNPEAAIEIPMTKSSAWTRALVAVLAVVALFVVFLARRTVRVPSPADAATSAPPALSGEAPRRRTEDAPTSPSAAVPSLTEPLPARSGTARPATGASGPAGGLAPTAGSSTSTSVIPLNSSSSGPASLPGVPVVAAASASSSSSAAPAPSNGWISVWSTPWGHVRIDGHDVGDSPAVRISVAAGNHGVSVKTEAGEQSRGVTVKPGEEAKVRFVF